MNDATSKSFHKVAKRMGWMDEGGLEETEKKLMSKIGKSRHAGTSGHGSASKWRNSALSESSDDEFDRFLMEKATPQAKASSHKPRSPAKTGSSNIVVVSSDDDNTAFETFLQRAKTPNTKPKKTSKSGSEDSLHNFIVDDYSSDDDFVEPKSSFKVPKKTNTPTSQPQTRRPLSLFNSPVFVSDDEDDDNIVLKSTWRTRHTRPKSLPKTSENTPPLCNDDETSPSLPSPPALSPLCRPSNEAKSLVISPKRTFSVPSKLDNSSSSEEEFTSLLERLKKKNNFIGNSFLPNNSKESNKEPAGTVSVPPVSQTPGSKLLGVKTPGKSSILKPAVSQSEPRHGPTSKIMLCKTPGCFLQSLTNPSSSYVGSFKHNKEALTSKLYHLYNTTVFESKLPANMSVTWNKKMRKTAGYCVTGQEKGGGNRYARIELSEKVCDSADRLRDTLIHEMCHAATWLINSVRDGHGNFWKLYARKATLAHPELPMVTRCHSYDIKYKFQYQCTRCKNTIGRHSKSLDTQRFVCALCTGQLVLLTPSKPRAPTPFANFVKENYSSVRQELAGQSHAEVMRKLSADFASKTKLSQS
ncbi:acidic repeat-containing protein isoform X1 [Neolamprologus brichardi]|uniref:acidic repeat-containing protein isoform X1 n=1 Tax=Neolamprologus brichardi TaxID=32507 RepID=UPI0003EBFFC8|nr:acidic repeat-containing protein isoform X1 [Neolamprologus brichardi]XP_006781655.1 acidic repeat-containing protein isoform X1 [Neolamprologus brichardi]